MTNRNFSMIEYFIRRSQENICRYGFNDEYSKDFESWKSELLNQLKTALGPFPEPVDLSAEIVYETRSDGLIKRRVILNLEKHMSVAALVYIPEAAQSKPVPAILCNHGHGIFGKDSVMGVTSHFDHRRKEDIDHFNYDYGLQMAKRGYVTMAIDWRGFGERSDNSNSYLADDKFPFPGRDKCNVHFIRGSLIGINLLALNLFDAKRSIDYLTSLKCVDSEKDKVEHAVSFAIIVPLLIIEDF